MIQTVYALAMENITRPGQTRLERPRPAGMPPRQHRNRLRFLRVLSISKMGRRPVLSDMPAMLALTSSRGGRSTMTGKLGQMRIVRSKE